jgi:hypothetical protein
MCRALTDAFDEADKDGDRRLSIQDLKKWLDEQASLHNHDYPTLQVPYPRLFGEQKGSDFYFTASLHDWPPYTFDWPDGSTLVLLPLIARKSIRWYCIAKHPITNAQYSRFVQEFGHHEPVGEHYHSGKWRGPFYPWHTPEFAKDDQPVVCVSAEDAELYCRWASSIASRSFRDATIELPMTLHWDFGAFGTEFPSRKPNVWLTQARAYHHNADAPISIEHTGERTNPRGISDMIGNIWEWCSAPTIYHRATLGAYSRWEYEVRGGGFLDDLRKTSPFLEAKNLPRHGENLRHSDLGFRIAANVALPSQTIDELKAYIHAFTPSVRDYDFEMPATA